MINEELLFKLLRIRHLTAQEKEEIGCDKIPISQIIEVIREVLEKERYFPVGVFPNVPGQAIYEGGIIEKLDKPTGFLGFFSYKYRLHMQRHHTLDPYALAEAGCLNYWSLTPVVKKYISIEWGKKDRDIDGINIDWHS